MRKPIWLSGVAWLTLGFIMIPLIMIALTAFDASPIIGFPLKGLTLKWFGVVFRSRSFMASLKTSFILAIIASLVGVAMALPAAIALNKRKSASSEFLLEYFLSPNLIPGIVLGFMLFRVLVIQFHIPLQMALVLGHILIVLPYSIRVLAAGLHAFDVSIEEAARTLGCSPFQAFRYTVVPYLKPTLVAAVMMSFISSFNNLPVSMFLKGPGINTLPAALMNHIEYNFDPSVSALSLILMVITFVLMKGMDHILGMEKVL